MYEGYQLPDLNSIATNTETKVPKVHWELCLMLLPVAVYIVLYSLSPYLPYFRCWEKMLTNNLLSQEYVFYPNQKCEMDETGDLGHHTAYAQPRKVKWFTNSSGHRYHSAISKIPDIYIVGDSFAVGSGVSQEHTLSSQIEENSNLRAYPYAKATMNDFVRDPKIQLGPGVTVVYESVSDGLGIKTLPIEAQKIQMNTSTLYDSISGPLVYYDDFFKLAYRNFIKASIGRYYQNLFGGQNLNKVVYYIDEDKKILYDDALEIALTRPDDKKSVEQVSRTIASYHNYVTSKGANFVFLLIPSKAEVHFDEHPLRKGVRKSQFSHFLMEDLKSKGVRVIEVESQFRQMFLNNNETYFKDDSHWNSHGIKVAAEKIISEISGKDL